MAKEKIDELNRQLGKMLERDGIKNAFYYEPGLEYFAAPEGVVKIAFCNLEPYYRNDKSELLNGFCRFPNEKFEFTEDVSDEQWSKVKTIRWTEIINYAIDYNLNGKHGPKIENEFGNKITEENLKRIHSTQNEDLWQSLIKCAAYFNFRYTAGKGVAQHGSDIVSLYYDANKKDYINFYKEYVKALECNVLVLGGKISCELANKIYPGLNLSFNDDTDDIKFHDGVLFVSIKHPSRIGYAYVAEVANKISDAYKEIK